jgi:flagellar biogenesis protein FliO
MKIIDRMMVSRDTSILLVQIGTRLLAVGSGKGMLSLICELSPSDFLGFAEKTAVGSSSESGGFWKRFARNMKANVTGSASETDADTSFAEVLMQIAEKDPPSGAEDAEDAGPVSLQEEEEISFPSRLRRPSYQVSIENMSRLSEPDNLDKREGRGKSDSFAAERLNRKLEEHSGSEKIDHVLDLIAKRQKKS